MIPFIAYFTLIIFIVYEYKECKRFFMLLPPMGVILMGGKNKQNHLIETKGLPPMGVILMGGKNRNADFFY